MSKKPELVLIPGAWHTPSHFNPLITKLRALGYTTHSAQLASVGNPDPPADLTEDIAIVRALVLNAIGDSGNDVVVLAHSWGGIIAGCALVGLGKKEREAQGLSGGVMRTGYMAAYILDEGICLQDAIHHFIPEWVDVQEPYVYAKVANIFYGDLPEDEGQYWFEQIKSQAVASFYAPATGAAWKEIPTNYLLCEDDECVPPQVQEGMVNGVKEAAGEIEVTRLKSGHSPFLSRAEETVVWVQRVAGDAV
ncbi:unnamed protein product [Alternaria alternata]|uniref:AB hydrolase-1 domain-containing protein n=1 Tax=Alternaria alternata TaxID=5599 RepID=A0A4Q4N441_ALTAL|nr:uncharacterized protein J4E82_008210 [Alternaria postmessia]KAI5373110.1 hypothetical protein J4E82_008210 [Alternaria postmessia]RYN70374.1 hypothetical protein AA0117_g10602 [Alternaria alternata]